MSTRKSSPPPASSIETSSAESSPRCSTFYDDNTEDEEEEKNVPMPDYIPSRPLTVSIPRGYAHAEGPYCPRRPNLSEILANTAPPPWTLSAFMAYLSQNHCLETLEFTMDASRYRKHYNKMTSRSPGGQISPSSEECNYVKMLWQRLLDAYIAPNGPREVNLPSDVRDSLLSQSNPYLPPHPSTLEPAVSKIYELMEESVLVPFLNSICPSSAYTQGVNTSQENLGSHYSQTMSSPQAMSAPMSGPIPAHRVSAPSNLTSPFSRSMTSAAAHTRFNSGPATTTSYTSAHRMTQSSYSSGASGSASDSLTDDSGSASSPSAIDDPMTPPTTPPMTDYAYGFQAPPPQNVPERSGNTPSPRHSRGEHGLGMGLAGATAHSWKRVSSKLGWKKRSGGALRGGGSEEPDNGSYEGPMF